MDKSNNLTIFLTDLADTLREVRGHSNPINPLNMSDEIREIYNSGITKDFSIETTTEALRQQLFYLLNGHITYEVDGVTYGVNNITVGNGHVNLYQSNAEHVVKLYPDGSYEIT